MMKAGSKKPSDKQTPELKVLLTFLKRTKSGKYATIDKSSYKYSRLNAQSDLSESDSFIYGLS